MILFMRLFCEKISIWHQLITNRECVAEEKDKIGRYFKMKLNIIIYIAMSHESSRWRRVGTKSGPKSHISKDSDKFNPKKASEIVQKNRQVFAISHIKGSQSQNLQSEKLLPKKPNSIFKTTSNFPQNYTPKSSDDKLIEDFSYKPSRINQNSSIKANPQSLSNYFQSIDLKIDPADSNEQKFKKFLRYIQRIEKQFQDNRVQIEAELMEQQKQITQMKISVVDSYMKKVNKVKDPQVRKTFEKLNYEKHRSTPKELVQVRSSENLKPNLFASGAERSSIRNSSIKKNNRNKIDKVSHHKNLKHSRASAHSSRSKASQTCKDKFGKIIHTLESMKKGLTQYKSNQK